MKNDNTMKWFLHIEIPFLAIVFIFPWLMSSLNNVLASVVISNIIFIIVYYLTCMFLWGKSK